MCILFIGINQREDYPLIVAANRDEFHARPTAHSCFWEPDNEILAGCDLEAGGTWMGINRKGQVAALTNIRAPGKELSDAISRGVLVSEFLQTPFSISEYHQKIASTRAHYNGYNLLFGQLNQLAVYNNYENSIQRLTDGVYGLSNATLNTPWPKLDFGKTLLANYCQQKKSLQVDDLFALLKNNTPADDHALPDTGISKEWEKMLSSIFIQSPQYGTRSSTVLLMDKHHKMYWQERTFDADASETKRAEYTFTLAN